MRLGLCLQEGVLFLDLFYPFGWNNTDSFLLMSTSPLKIIQCIINTFKLLLGLPLQSRSSDDMIKTYRSIFKEINGEKRYMIIPLLC